MANIYLDHHATTPTLPELPEVMAPYFTEQFGNPASTHSFGQRAQMAVSKARTQVAALLNADPQQVIFTSGATESIHSAIIGWLLAQEKPSECLILSSSIEHKATMGACDLAKKLGAEVIYLPVNGFGEVHPTEIFKNISKDRPTLLSLIHAHNEVGTIQNIETLTAQLKSYPKVTFHLDAAQSVGKVPIDFKNLNIHMLSLSGHKLYGPKGIGALVLKNARLIKPLFQGGGQEFNLRAGTLNVPAIVGLGYACDWAKKNGAIECQRLASLRDLFFEIIKAEAPTVKVNGHPTQRLPHNINITLGKGTPETIAFALNDIAFSSGSACSAGNQADNNHVLSAMGLTADQALSTLRLGLGLSTTEEHVRYTAQKIIQFVRK